MNDSENTRIVPIEANTPSRRGLLGTLAAAAAIAGTARALASPAEPNPDAKLISMCRALAELDAETDRISEAADDLPAPARYAARHAIDALVHGPNGHHEQRAAIAMTQAKTLAGFQAKAAFVRRLDFAGDGYADPTDDGAVGWSLANDLLGLPTIWKDDAADDLQVALKPWVNPDTDLIAACQEFNETEERIRDLYPTPATLESESEWDAIIAPLREAQEDLLDRICAMRATSLAGFVARAKTLAAYAPDLVEGAEEDGGYVCERMAAALLRDLVGGDVA